MRLRPIRKVNTKRLIISFVVSFLSGLSSGINRVYARVANKKIKQLEPKNENENLKKLLNYLLECNKFSSFLNEVDIILCLVSLGFLLKNITSFDRMILVSRLFLQLPDIVNFGLSLAALQEVKNLENAER